MILVKALFDATKEKTYVPVPHAHQVPPEGHVGLKAGSEAKDILRKMTLSSVKMRWQYIHKHNR
jgi:hypothetical protein